MNQYGLLKLTVMSCLAVAVLSIGVLGVGGGGGAPWVSAVKKGNMPTVLAAAPPNITRIFPENLQSVSLYAPPPYSKVTFLKTHRSHTNPSSCCATPSKTVPETLGPGTVGTVGIAAGMANPCERCCSCARIDAWIPKSSKNIVQAPIMNDPNAMVILDITPPSEGSGRDCAECVYHYGNAPSKQSDSKPPLMRVGTPEAQPLPQ